MEKGRLTAFSDGVIAIIITIMVLELKAPHEPSLQGLLKLVPVLLSYTISFVIVAIYWINHHHLLSTAEHVNGRILWANIHLLFWMSLIPWASAYAGENHGASLAVALYGGLSTACSGAFLLLRCAIFTKLRADSRGARFHQAAVRKNILSMSLMALSAPLAFVSVPLAVLVILFPPVMHFMPDRRLESPEEEK